MKHQVDLVDFERPPFAAAKTFEAVSYIRPSPSFRGMSVGRYRNARSPIAVSDPWDATAVYQVPVLFRGTPAHSAWRDGRHVELPSLPAGAVVCFDMRDSWQVELCYPFDSLHFYVPQGAFDEFTDELNLPRIEQLTCLPIGRTVDTTLHHLALALASLMDTPSMPPMLLTDQILCSVRTHLAFAYGGVAFPGKHCAGLSERQVDLMRGLLLDDLHREVRLSELATACGMPVIQFRRSFKLAFGRSPQRWRISIKVERARQLLELSNRPLAEVAGLCGFADQSHMTRIFSRSIGVSPGAYRRARRG